MRNVLLGLLPLILVVLLGAAASAPAGSGTLAECVSGCRPNDTACLDCCGQSFPTVAETACLNEYRECTGMCESLTGLKALMCERGCQDKVGTCIGPSAEFGPFDCPEWIEPLECPECQTWSPRLQKCVGAPRELCDPK